MALKSPYGNGPESLARSPAQEELPEDFDAFDGDLAMPDQSVTAEDPNALPSDFEEFASAPETDAQGNIIGKQGPSEFLGSSRLEEMNKGLIDANTRKYFKDADGSVYSVDNKGNKVVTDEKTKAAFDSLAGLVDGTVGALGGFAEMAAGTNPALAAAYATAGTAVMEYMSEKSLTDEYRKISGKQKEVFDRVLSASLSGIAAGIGKVFGNRMASKAGNAELASDPAIAAAKQMESEGIDAAAKSQDIPLMPTDRNPEDIALRSTREYLESGQGGAASMENIENFRNQVQGPAIEKSTQRVIENVGKRGKSFTNARDYVESLSSDLKANLDIAKKDLAQWAGDAQFDVSQFLPSMEQKMKQFGITFVEGKPTIPAGNGFADSLQKDLIRKYYELKNVVKSGSIGSDQVSALVSSTGGKAPQFKEVKVRVSDPVQDEMWGLTPKFETKMEKVSNPSGATLLPPNKGGEITRGATFDQVESFLDDLQQLANFDTAKRAQYEKAFGSLSGTLREIRDDLVEQVGGLAKKKGATDAEAEFAVSQYKNANKAYARDIDDIYKIRSVVQDDPTNAAKHLLRADKVESEDYVKSLLKVFDEDGRRQLGAGYLENLIGDKTKDTLSSEAFEKALKSIPQSLQKELYGDVGVKSLKELSTVMKAIEKSKGRVLESSPELAALAAKAAGKSGLGERFFNFLIKKVLAPYPDAKKFLADDMITAVRNAEKFKGVAKRAKVGAKAAKAISPTVRSIAPAIDYMNLEEERPQ